MTVHTPFHPLLAVLVTSGLLGTPTARAQESASVSGAVIDAITGAGILGVRVVVLGSAHWTTTRSDGRYTIEGVAPGLVKVMAQSIGYYPITTPFYSLKPNATTAINFKLAPLVVSLAPIEIVGEQPTTRRVSGARVVTSEELPTGGNVLDALQGLISGVRRMGRHEDTRLSVRESRADVLYVIDGLVITPPLTFYVDAGDVQCVEFRPGSSATLEFRPSIFGERYSGVLLIWTKGNSAPMPGQCYNEKKSKGN